jgi:hypothetical protein
MIRVHKNECIVPTRGKQPYLLLKRNVLLYHTIQNGVVNKGSSGDHQHVLGKPKEIDGKELHLARVSFHP